MSQRYINSTMKKVLHILILFSLLQTVQAQTADEKIYPLNSDQKSPDFLQYRNRWNLKLGAGFGTTWRYKENLMDASAFSLSAEPSYRLTNYIAIGMRGEYTFMKSYLAKSGRINSSNMGSISLTGDVIKLWKNQYAPFIGLGAGAYFLGSGEHADGNLTNEDIPGDRQKLGTRFGVSPRIGMNIKSFSVAVEVHLIDEKTFHNRDYAILKVGYTL